MLFQRLLPFQRFSENLWIALYQITLVQYHTLCRFFLGPLSEGKDSVLIGVVPLLKDTHIVPF